VLDEAAQNLGAMLRSDWREPRSDGDLAAAGGLSPAEAQASLRALVAAGEAVRVARNLHFDRAALAELCEQVLAILERDGATTIAAVRNELSTSRKYAQTLLEHLDATKVTVRRGDEHVLRRGRN
jgi:selenocysteine-specific elongation factor